jgi:uncharacterized protein (TIGR02757 family)
MNQNELKARLDYHYKAFNRESIEPDPLQFLHLYSDEKDIETIGFIASVLAYGQVNQINKSIQKIIDAAENKPHHFVISLDADKLKRLQGIVHRFYTSEDISNLLLTLSKIYLNYDSLKNYFLQNYNESEKNLKNSISLFSRRFLSEFNESKITAGIRFMLPDPHLNSACKRINLFLRWMVRKDELDFGLWNEIPASKLTIPVDTHIAQICRRLKLTGRKNITWQMAEEITDKLRDFDPEDPVKYDFAICHIGMRGMEF